VNYDLGYFDLETRVLEPLENHFGPTVLPMFPGGYRKVVRPGGFELPTFWFVARRSIQLSYGRAVMRKEQREVYRGSRVSSTRSRNTFAVLMRKQRAVLSGLRTQQQIGGPPPLVGRRLTSFVNAD
jgi:hypothetical protein